VSLKKRERRVTAGGRTVKSYPEIPLDQALDLVISVKRAEGLRERTLKDYVKNHGYFADWLCRQYPEVSYAGEITNAMIRDHVSYLRYNRVRYDGHTNIPTENQRVGL